MKFSMGFSGIVILLLVAAGGFWLGKNKPSLLGGVI